MQGTAMNQISADQISASAPAKDPAVRVELSQLEKTVAGIEEAIAELAGRLGDLLSAAGPKSESDRQEEKSLCGLAQTIKDCHWRVAACLNRVRDLIGRLEV